MLGLHTDAAEVHFFWDVARLELVIGAREEDFRRLMVELVSYIETSGYKHQLTRHHTRCNSRYFKYFAVFIYYNVWTVTLVRDFRDREDDLVADYSHLSNDCFSLLRHISFSCYC